jgi:hypothetical protein
MSTTPLIAGTIPAGTIAAASPSDDDVYAKAAKAKAECYAFNKLTLLAFMRENGIAQFVAHFDGSGDSGDFEDFDVLDAAGQHMNIDIDEVKIDMLSSPGIYAESSNPEIQNASVRAVIEDISWDAIGREHGGWENNDGGFGKVTIDAKAETVHLEMNARFTDYNTTEHVY